MHSAKTVERLEQVIRVLEELPKEKKLDMGQWMTCGTIGCAIGWAASDPWFTRRGLKLVEDWEDQKGKMTYVPVFRDEEDLDAVGAFFGLEWEDATALFGDIANGTKTRCQVIHNIKRFIKG